MNDNLNETSIQNALTEQVFMEVQFVAKLFIKTFKNSEIVYIFDFHMQICYLAWTWTLKHIGLVLSNCVRIRSQ